MLKGLVLGTLLAGGTLAAGPTVAISASPAAHARVTCQGAGTLSFTPPLTNTPQSITYKIKLSLSGCVGHGSPVASGSLVVLPTSASLSCAGGQSTGFVRITWSDSKTTLSTFRARFTASSVNLGGHVKAGTETAFRADRLRSAAAFSLDPTACAGSGVSVTGVTGLVKLVP